MVELRQYILSIIAAAVICGIIIRLVNEKTQTGALVKMLAGLFLTLTVISPLAKIQLSNISTYITELEFDSHSITEAGETMAQESMSSIIMAQTESYILEKASSLHLNVSVDVKLSQDAIPVPREITIKGDASPYAKAQLQSCIVNDIGISEEYLTWK